MGEILQQFDRGSSTTMETPDPAISADALVAKAQPSVVKVRGVAERCGKVLEGSGFVVAPNRVMTDAHVVAGAETFSMDAEGKTYDAHVVPMIGRPTSRSSTYRTCQQAAEIRRVHGRHRH
jgi:S1-C subfamily serine protease